MSTRVRMGSLHLLLALSVIVITNGDKVCNPLDFGAKGNGETDDTKAIQDAIDACSDLQSQTIITFPSNYSFLSFPIKIKD